MENKDKKVIELKHAFDIFKREDFQKHFGKLNLELLKGNHIEKDTYYLFKILEKYFDELQEYYDIFYNLNLKKTFFENHCYYYLSFTEDSKGLLSNQSLHKELTAMETITAITLLHMYYERQFIQIKEITFLDIRTKIMKSEYNKLYKKVFFKSPERENYTKKEWSYIIKKFKTVISDFEQIGWVKNINTISEDNFSFTLKGAIHRFQLMYEDEIYNFEEFVGNLKNSENE